MADEISNKDILKKHEKNLNDSLKQFKKLQTNSDEESNVSSFGNSINNDNIILIIIAIIAIILLI